MGKRPENAQVTVTRVQVAGITLLVILLGIAFWQFGIQTLIVIVGLCTTLFSALFVLKSYLTLVSIQDGLVQVTEAEICAITEWPLYTVLIPLRGEESMVKRLIKSLSTLDYPKEQLQILLLVEENDPRTVNAVLGMKLTAPFETVILADEGPRTKPKACTVGLEFVRGEYTVIFDAEDRPEPDQLKKAVIAHRRFGDAIWCIQAKLEYHNSSQNWLTRLFAGEYATYFNLALPALGARDLFVPLGGTSNHFRTEKLQEMGGWDPWNVTEDLDLGVVIARKGGLVKVIDSVTWEEANSVAGNWVRQRSRWVKGHMQTLLVHLQHPLQLWRDLGPKNSLVFALIVGGTPASLLLSPIFLITTMMYVLMRTVGAQVDAQLAFVVQLWIEQLFPPVLFYLGMFAFLVGNFSLVYFLLMGCMHRGLYAEVKYMLLAPMYWLLMSLATWKALFQLVRNPHYWEKTNHGLDVATVRVSKARTLQMGWAVKTLIVVLLALLLVGCEATRLAAIPAPPVYSPPAANRVLQPTAGFLQYGGAGVMAYGNWGSEEDHVAVLDRLKASGANSVSFVFPFFQEDPWATEVYTDTELTPTDDQIRLWARLAHERQMSMLLRPTMDEQSLVPHDRWRGTIWPDDLEQWFASYSKLMIHYARLAEEEGISLFSIGAELNSLEHETAYWVQLIQDVHAVYSGKLVYSANWGINSRVQFWGELDYIGLDAFFNLDAPDNATVEQLIEAWQPWVAMLREQQEAVDKPVIFTETGVQSGLGSYREPWRWVEHARPSQEDQAAYYAATCEAARQLKVVGVYWWAVGRELPDYLQGSDDVADGTHNFIGKLAEREVYTCFTGE